MTSDTQNVCVCYSFSPVQLLVIQWTRLLHLFLLCTILFSCLNIRFVSSFIESIHPFFSLSLQRLPEVIPSIISFSIDSCRFIMCPNYDKFNLAIEAFSEKSGFISSKMDWFVFLSVHGTHIRICSTRVRGRWRSSGLLALLSTFCSHMLLLEKSWFSLF